MTTTFGLDRPRGEGIESLGALSDGSVLAAGTVARGREAVVRFLPDGRLDRRYGDAGAAEIERSRSPQLVARPGGRATVLALSGGYREGPVLVQLDARGRPDAGFGRGDGRLVLPMRGAASVAGTADGGSVVTGTARGSSRLAVVRVKESGTLDAGFGRRGVATPLPTARDGAAPVAVQRDGRIVILADIGTAREPRRVLVRLSAAGELDRSFGDGDGIADVPWRGLRPADPIGLHLDTQDRSLIHAAGFDRPMRILRYTHAGALDASFGVSGSADIAVPRTTAGIRSATATDALIFVTDSRTPTLLRVSAQGRLDSATPLRLPFGGGLTHSDNPAALQGTGFAPNALALRRNGSVLLGGSTSIDVFRGAGAAEIALAALLPDGRLDTRFGGPPRTPPRARILRGRPDVRRRRALAIRLAPRHRGAARVQVSAGGRTLARGVIPLLAARPTTHVLPLNAEGRRFARRAPSGRVTVQLTVTDLAGNRSRARVRATLRASAWREQRRRRERTRERPAAASVASMSRN